MEPIMTIDFTDRKNKKDSVVKECLMCGSAEISIGRIHLKDFSEKGLKKNAKKIAKRMKKAYKKPFYISFVINVRRYRINYMDSNYIKMCLLNYFRFRRNMLCCTESAGALNSISDVSAITWDQKTSYEVEVKVSISDLKADFNKNKHYLIEKRDDFKIYYKFFSNYFYYCVPEEIWEKALQVIKTKRNPYYGLLYISNLDYLRPDRKIKFVKKSRKAIGSNIELYNQLLKRTSSELVNMHNKKYG